MAAQERKPRARKKKTAGDALSNAGEQAPVNNDRTERSADSTAERHDTSASRTTVDHIQESMQSGLHPYGEVF